MREIILAVVPSAMRGDRKAALDAVCAALSKLLVDVTVRGVLPTSYAALATGLERDQIQYAWMSPALVVLTEEQIKLQPLLVAVRNEQQSYNSALFVEASSSFDTVVELEGQTIAWVDPSSAAGYLCPRIALAARGIDPSTFFGRELFLGSHEQVVRAVFDGRAQVGATYGERPTIEDGPILRGGFLDVDPDHPVRVLEWSPPIPHDVIAGHGLISMAEHRVFSNAILTLASRADGRQLLYDAFHTEQFTIASSTALRPLRDLVRQAREHGLLNQL
ncbi:MAG: PhnD/SsuA/transferrin family substrate-binding protein [Proteobacteria bacterium]|nr:PhnD/SsuA/transferrin family substrate-binding protein [Pseudomonadota bacterium]